MNGYILHYDTPEARPPIRQARGATTECGKVGFATERAADAAARNTVSNRGTPDQWPRPYACDDCGWYHVGHAAPEVLSGLATYDEWVVQNAAAAVRQATGTIVRAVDLKPTWSRVGEAWRVTVEHPVHGPVASKPSADPGLAVESLLARLKRLPAN